MSDDTRRDEQRDETEGFSRRRFLEHTATAGGAALVGVAASRNSRAQEGGKSASGNRTELPKPVKLKGKMIEYKSGDLMIPAYLSSPKTQRVAPGAVLVIHEVFGLNDHIKSIADRISNEGFVALAPNFFVRASEPPPKDATDTAALRKAASSIPPEKVKELEDALKKAGKQVDIKIYDGAGHGFFNDTRAQAYNATAAADA